MLRPATPLTVLLFAAFALLLISVISTPIVRGIPLASEGGVDFGVFGFCKASVCSSIEIGYSTDKLSASENASFDLPTSTRKTLSSILIVHPVAAFLTLIMLILAASAHFHSPSHSPRYLLCVFIGEIFTLLVSLLCFLVDVLIFAPHMSWGSYIVLAATILIFISGIVSCAMRRTLVGRKARKKRIAENAEMGGESYYNRTGGATIPPIATTATASGALGTETKAQYASFEVKTNSDPSRISDERMPLTAMLPSGKNKNGVVNAGYDMGGKGMDERYAGPPRIDSRGVMNPNAYAGRDEYGNSMPPSFGAPRSRDPSQDSYTRNAYTGGPVPRGRGVPMVRGRGGYGPPPGRGGFAPPGRADFTPGRGGYGPPGRAGYGPPLRGGYGPAPNYRGGMMGRGRGPPPGYTNGYNGQPPQAYGRTSLDYDERPVYATGREPSPHRNQQGYIPYRSSNSMDLPRAESPPPLIPGMPNSPSPPPPIGQAIEMDARTGSPSRNLNSYSTNSAALRDGDVAGMVGLQQMGLPAHLRPGNDGARSDMSQYSSNEPYVPPPQAWSDAGPPPGLDPSPLDHDKAEIPNEAVELPADTYGPDSHLQAVLDSLTQGYVEDVEPRFAEPEPELPRSHSTNSHANSHAGSFAGSHRTGSRAGDPPPHLQLTTTQVPGVAAYNPNLPQSNYAPNIPQSNYPNSGGLHPNMGGLRNMPQYDGTDYDDINGIPSGSRSPAESDGGQSNFTSISQRGINPRWTGDRGAGGNGSSNLVPPHRPVPARNDQAILLNSNPDFELPGIGPAGRGNAGGRGNNERGMAPRRALIGGGPYPGS